MYNEDERKLEELIQVYKRIVLHLNMLVESGAMEGYDRYLIASMTVKVVEHLAKDYVGEVAKRLDISEEKVKTYL